MAADRNLASKVDSEPSQNAPAPAASDGNAAPLGFATVARRISTWTTNSLLTGILLVAALGFGRQILIWWKVDAKNPSGVAPPAMQDDGLGDPTRIQAFQFGDQNWTIHRQAIVGPLSAANKELVSACIKVVGHSRPLLDAPDEAERRFLAGLAGKHPVAESQGEWRIYQSNEGMPMVAGVRDWAPEAASGRTRLAEMAPRVVIWGIAVPMGSEGWTLYVFQPEVEKGTRSEGFPEIPLPPEGKRLASVRAAGGGSMLAFETAESPETCRRFYDRWFAEGSWKAQGVWQSAGSAWHARFVAGAKDAVFTADMRLATDRNGNCSGLAIISRGN